MWAHLTAPDWGPAMSTLKTLPLEAAVKSAVAKHNQKLGGAKGRLHQKATREAAEAKARAEISAKARASVAMHQIDAEIAEAAAKIQALRPAANDARGGWRAADANRQITRLLAKIKDLREERQHFVTVCC